ncbi:class I SAM-dependent methyltransferase [Nonomuraea sp. NPDC046802]|uniref:class I SAM-dependent methyltransferase n=1 Tax=Nonomuraea sp. NPDC046802 TaxID=3154919 RepID=UPI0034115DB7
MTVIDSGFDENSFQDLDLTNRIAVNVGTRATAIKATSPRDVGTMVASILGGVVDLTFIDGFHTPAQIVADWRALRAFLHEDAVVLFHDVLFSELLSGFELIVAESGWQGTLLHSTTTGIGVLVCDPEPRLAAALRAFAGGPAAPSVARATATTATGGHAQLSQAWRRCVRSYPRNNSPPSLSTVSGRAFSCRAKTPGTSSRGSRTGASASLEPHRSSSCWRRL